MNNNNIKHLKINFKKICKRYKINKEGKLCFYNLIHRKNRKTNNIENDYEDNKKEYEWYLLPTIKELNDYLYKFHSDIFHSNYKELKLCFLKNKIWFLGLDKILEEYISNCAVCSQSSRTLLRLDPVKPIIVEGQDYRTKFDITYLNKDMDESFNVKYLLSIIDVFSRKTMIYGLNNKKSDIILNYIIEYCLHTNFPKEFCSDNGLNLKISI